MPEMYVKEFRTFSKSFFGFTFADPLMMIWIGMVDYTKLIKKMHDNIWIQKDMHFEFFRKISFNYINVPKCHGYEIIVIAMKFRPPKLVKHTNFCYMMY